MTTATMTLETFANEVKAAAGRVPVQHLFGRKAFISHVWAIGGFDVSLDAFKATLWAAHQAGLVVLSRADLPEAMDAHDVKRSTLAAMGATFNFIRVI